MYLIGCTVFFYQHPSIHTLEDIHFLRTVVALYTEISGTLFWSTFIVLHRQNILYSAQGLSKKCIIYVRVLRKHWKSKRQQLYSWVMNAIVSKITHCPCMSLCSIPIALWHIFWNPKPFQTYTQLNLNNSNGGKQESEEPIPDQKQSFDSRFRSSWLGVCPCMGSPRRFQSLKRNIPKKFALPSHSAAQMHIITATFAIKSRARHRSKQGFIAF